MQNKNKIRVTQIHESVDYDGILNYRTLKF